MNSLYSFAHLFCIQLFQNNTKSQNNAQKNENTENVLIFLHLYFLSALN